MPSAWAGGERVAIVSPNSARLLVTLFGVSGWGRVVVPINFRLNAEEVGYIVRHSGASVLLVDPELDEALAGVTAPHRFVLGAESDAVLFPDGREPVPWRDPDENAVASINYTSGTTARPKGVELTHRNLYVNALTLGWHTGVDESDVYLWSVPMFHCNGWGLVYAITGMGGRHVILRKVDGPEILHRIDRHGVTFMGGAPAVVNTILAAAPAFDSRLRGVPGHGRMRIVSGGAPPAHGHDPTGRDAARVGVHPRLRPDRDLAAAHAQPATGRVGHAGQRRAGPAPGGGRPAGDRRPPAHRPGRRGRSPGQRGVQRLLATAGGYG
jgi:acyl-CoA synthetase (AMP-forming)/AMP-acid ligase II